jgi:hypothetical protein
MNNSLLILHVNMLLININIIMIVFQLGTLVCPVMPLVGVISTAIFFAVNYLMVTVMCKPPVKRWNQARRNTLFLGLTAATLIVLIGPISVVITRSDLIHDNATLQHHMFTVCRVFTKSL